MNERSSVVGRRSSVADDSPFDAAAARYDAEFTDRRLGWMLRRQVWDQIEPLIRAGDRILDLGCGTGEDACWLAGKGAVVTAADQSPAMLSVASRKAAKRSVADRISFLALDAGSGIPLLVRRARPERNNPFNPLTKSVDRSSQPSFRAVLGNFGMLNCLSDRRPLAEALGSLVSPGGWVALVVMSPVCPWEVGWYLGHRDPERAFRRFQRSTPAQVGGAAFPVWYPSPARIISELAPWFRHRRTAGIGVLLPPSYLAHLVDRAPGLFGLLDQADRIVAGWPGRWINDHALILMERR